MTATDAERQRKRWAKRTPEQIAARYEYKKRYWESMSDEAKDQYRARERELWHARSDEQKRIHSIRKRSNKYGLSPETIEKMLSAGCQFPSEDHSGLLHIDHDHACCPGVRSCGKCVRGVMCAAHNTLVGQFEKIAPHLVWVVGYLSNPKIGEDTK
jgi:hypothetical protein